MSTNNANMAVFGDNTGIIIAGSEVKDSNLINAGDVTGNNNTIIAATDVVLNQIQHKSSAIEEMETGIRFAERRLADAVARKIQQLRDVATKTDNDQRQNPYKSLLDYRLVDTAYFYGRDEAIHQLLGKIHDHRLTILYADSGSGKSSLLQAGLMARLLAAGHLPLHLRTADQPPSFRIKHSFLPDFSQLPELERFTQMSLVGFLQNVSSYLGESTLYIFLDQFEEFFLDLSTDQQKIFAKELADCLDQAGLNVRWILSLRKEQFSELSLFQPRISPFVNEFFLPTFKLSEAKEVLIEPALQHGVTYEYGLVDAILADLQDEDGSIQPAQVQIVCYNLFIEVQASSTPQQITTELYSQPRGSGYKGARGILSNHLTNTLKDMSASERKLSSRILEALITSSTRRARLTLNDLQAELTHDQPSSQTEVIPRVLQRLVNDRLLRVDEDEEDTPLYELAHDYLLNEIELDEDTLQRKFAQELLNQQVEAWQADSNIRIAEETLEIIERQESVLRVDANSAKLLQLSREAIGRRRQIVRYSYGAAAFAMAGAIIAGIFAISLFGQVDDVQEQLIQAEGTTTAFAINQSTAEAVATATLAMAAERIQQGEATATSVGKEVQRMRSQAESIRLAAEALIQLDDDPELALLLSQYALINEEYTVDADSALRKSLHTNRIEKVTTLDESARGIVFIDGGTSYIQAIANGSYGTIQIHKTHAEAPANELIHIDSLVDYYGLAFTPANGGLIAISGLQRTKDNNGQSIVKVWDYLSQTEVISLAETDHLFRDIQFSQDGHQVLIRTTCHRTSKNTCHMTQIWDIRKQKLLNQIEGQWDGPLTYNSTGEYIAISNQPTQGKVSIWDSQLEQKVAEWHVGETDLSVHDIAFNPIRSELVTGDSNGVIKIWEISTTGSITNAITLIDTITKPESAIIDIKYSPDGQCIAAAGYDQKVHLWNLKDDYIMSLPGHKRFAGFVEFIQPTSTSITHVNSLCDSDLVSVDGDNRMFHWNIGDTYEYKILGGHQTAVEDVEFSPSGDSLISTGDDGTAVLWDSSTFQPTAVFTHSVRINKVDFTPDGSEIATAGWDGSVKIWETQTASLLKTITTEQRRVYDIAFQPPTGKNIATAGTDGTVKLWNINTGSLINSWDAAYRDIHSIDFDPNGQYIVLGAKDGEITLIDIETSIVQKIFQDQTSEIYDIIINPIKPELITVDSSGRIRFWNYLDENSGFEKPAIEAHNGPASSIDFSNHKNMIVTGGHDGVISLWNLDTDRSQVLATHNSIINDVEFSLNDAFIAVASENGTVELYVVNISDLIELASNRVMRNLSPHECNQFGLTNKC